MNLDIFNGADGDSPGTWRTNQILLLTKLLLKKLVLEDTDVRLTHRLGDITQPEDPHVPPLDFAPIICRLLNV